MALELGLYWMLRKKAQRSPSVILMLKKVRIMLGV